MDPIRAFTQILADADGPGGPVALDSAAACIAAAARGEERFEPDSGVEALDALAAECPAVDFATLARWLFVTEAFAGNREDYTDPRNSYLPDVLDRRLGIPITLTLVMMEVGRRRGIGVLPIGMPGHFLAGDALDPERFCDPFHGGVLLDRAGCERRFVELHGPAVAFRVEMLAPVTHAMLLDRMLANLQHRAFSERHRDLAWLTRLRLAIPGRSPLEAEALAGLLAESGHWALSRREYDTLLAAARARNDAPAQARIERALVALRARAN